MDKDTEFLTMAEAEMASLENWLEEPGMISTAAAAATC